MKKQKSAKARGKKQSGTKAQRLTVVIKSIAVMQLVTYALHFRVLSTAGPGELSNSESLPLGVFILLSVLNFILFLVYFVSVDFTKKTQDWVLVGLAIVLTSLTLLFPTLQNKQDERSFQDAWQTDLDMKNEVRYLQQQLEIHYNDHGSYPDTLSGLSPIPSAEKLEDHKGKPYDYVTDGRTFKLSADLMNDNDPDAVEGRYTIRSVN
jgi:type II secretory pathway pseudopilin PulG